MRGKLKKNAGELEKTRTCALTGAKGSTMAKRKRSKATEAKKREQQFELQKQLLFGNLLENDLKAWIFI